MEKREAPQKSGKPPNSPEKNVPPRQRRRNRKRGQQSRNGSAASSPQGAGVDVCRNAQQGGRRLWYPPLPSPDVQGSRGNRFAGDRVVYARNVAPSFAHPGGGAKGMLLYGPMTFMPGPPVPSHFQPAIGNQGGMCGPIALPENWRAPQRPGPSYASVLKKDTKQSSYLKQSPRKQPCNGNVAGAEGPATNDSDNSYLKQSPRKQPCNGNVAGAEGPATNDSDNSYLTHSPRKQPCNGNAAGAEGPATHDSDNNRNSWNKAEEEAKDCTEVKDHAEVKGEPESPRAENDEAKRDPTSEVTKSMEGMLLSILRGPKEDEGAELCAEGTTPFATMALQMEPITKDRGVLKRVVHPGWGQLVSPGSGVAFHYEAFLENSSTPFYSTQKHKQPYRCVVEEARIVGLSFAVATMRKGERAWVLVSPPYGSDQSKQHPTRCGFADKTVLYKVELLQIIDPQDKLKLHTFVNDGALRRMPFREVLKLCDISRQRAAAYYKSDQFFQALGCYTAAIQALEEAQTDDAAENAEGNNMLLGLYNNAALCSIKTGKGKLAVMYAERALERNPQDANALYRCGVGLKMQSKFDKATQCLFKALKLRPNSVAIAEELRVVGSLKRLQLASSDETAFCPRPDRKLQTSHEQLPPASGKDSLPVEWQTVSSRMRSRIRERLESLRVAKPGTSLSFTVGFNDVHIDFIRTTCWMMGLRCELLQDGVIVYGPSGEESG